MSFGVTNNHVLFSANQYSVLYLYKIVCSSL